MSEPAWHPCDCGETAVKEIREHSECRRCGRRYRRPPALAATTCPNCAAELKTTRHSGECLACGKRRDAMGMRAPVRRPATQTLLAPRPAPRAPVPTRKQEPAPRAPVPTRKQEPAVRTHAATESDALVRIVLLFAVVGLGLGLGTILFLLVTGFFSTSQNVEDLGDVFLGGLAVVGALVFALLSGVVLAAVGGLQLARAATSRGRALAFGFLSGAAGHIALVAVLGAILLGGVALFGSSREAGPPQRSDAQRCRELFGEESEFCKNQSETVPEPSGGPSIEFGQVARLSLGVIPAGIVGALSAALFVSRREP